MDFEYVLLSYGLESGLTLLWTGIWTYSYGLESFR